MRLNELTEALDNPYPYTWHERSNDTWTAYAELNTERSSDGRDDEDATLRIIADRVSGDDWGDPERVVPTIWELSFMTGYKTHKTGAGDQFRIFATVAAAFTDWWEQMGSKVNDIDELEFTADKAKDGKSRAVLYARFAKKFAQMTGFNLETKQDSYQDVFTFVNPQSSFAEASVTEKVSVPENFKDGKNPGRKGLSKRVGIPTNATLAQLEKIAKNSDGEKRRMAQWQLNMRRGKNR